jgi:hypothetical protein
MFVQQQANLSRCAERTRGAKRVWRSLFARPLHPHAWLIVCACLQQLVSWLSCSAATWLPRPPPGRTGVVFKHGTLAHAAASANGV